jgi:hypothetical protein
MVHCFEKTCARYFNNTAKKCKIKDKERKQEIELIMLKVKEKEIN